MAREAVQHLRNLLLQRRGQLDNSLFVKRVQAVLKGFPSIAELQRPFGQGHGPAIQVSRPLRKAHAPSVSWSTP